MVLNKRGSCPGFPNQHSSLHWFSARYWEVVTLLKSEFIAMIMMVKMCSRKMCLPSFIPCSVVKMSKWCFAT